MGGVRDTWRNTLDLYSRACHPRNSADYDCPATPFASLLLPSGELCMGYSLFAVWQHQPALGSLPHPPEFSFAANPNQRAFISPAKTDAFNSYPSYRPASSRIMKDAALPASTSRHFSSGIYSWI